VVRRRAGQPVVREVEDRLEPLAREQRRHAFQVAAIGLKVLNLGSEVVTIATVENGDVVPTREQALDDGAANELGTPDDQRAHVCPS